MSTMTHECEDCGKLEFDNEETKETPCERCGSLKFMSSWDEGQYE